MTYKKIVLAGGSGFLGEVLAAYFAKKSETVFVLSRNVHPGKANTRYLQWDGKNEGAWTNHLEDADLLVNLSGKNVNCRYTPENKAEIFASRLEPTALLGRVISKLKQPPKVWINLASATIYRHAEDRMQDEENGEIGEGFSVEVCKAWEKQFFSQPTPRTKKIAFRTSMVLGRNGGVMVPIIRMSKLGLGGKQGNGRQYMSWIHEHDFAAATEWAILHGMDGEVLNITAPSPVQNHQFMKAVRNAFHIRIGLPSPKWLLELGAVFIRTETELVLKSRWVYPKRLLERGFRFIYPDITAAMEEIANNKA